MKKYGFLTLLLIELLVVLTGCQKERELYIFEGVIKLTNPEMLIVEVPEEYSISRINSTIAVPVNSEFSKDLQIGDYVSVSGYLKDVNQTAYGQIETVTVTRIDALSSETGITDDYLNRKKIAEAKKNESDAWVPDDVIAYPPKLNVNIDNISLEVDCCMLNWAYRVSEEEWSSVLDNEMEPIDMEYDEYFEVENSEFITLSVSFDTDPFQIIEIKRYPAEYIDETYSEGASSISLRQRIERSKEYKDYEEIILPAELSYPYKFDVENNQDYLYVLTAVWDSSEFRGTADYSFLVRKKKK